MKVIELIGRRFGRLTVISRAGSNSSRKATWQCQCDCGAVTIVSGGSLRSGNTSSCGCYRRERQAQWIAAHNAREIVTYGGAHDRVIRVRGRASAHTCIDCDQPADEWSYSKRDPQELCNDRGRAFSLDPTYYDPRCRPCHRTLDANRSSSPAPRGMRQVTQEGARA